MSTANVVETGIVPICGREFVNKVFQGQWDGYVCKRAATRKRMDLFTVWLTQN